MEYDLIYLRYEKELLHIIIENEWQEIEDVQEHFILR